MKVPSLTLAGTPSTSTLAVGSATVPETTIGPTPKRLRFSGEVIATLGNLIGAGAGASVGVGVAVGTGVAVGVGVAVGTGVAVGIGVAAGASVAVGVGATCGATTGEGIAVGAAVGVGVASRLQASDNNTMTKRPVRKISTPRLFISSQSVKRSVRNRSGAILSHRLQRKKEKPSNHPQDEPIITRRRCPGVTRAY